MLNHKSILIYDIETDGLDVSKSKCKWFGAYSYRYDKYYLLPYTDMKEIKALMRGHKVLVGFNNKEFDNEILYRQHEVEFKYKNIIDLYMVSKQRLAIMGYEMQDYKLKTIIDVLKLANDSKGEIDFNIFKKDIWDKKEEVDIKKYLKQDIVITKLLFEWMSEQFKPLRKLLCLEDKEKYMDVKASLASLAARVVTNLAGIKNEFRDKDDVVKRESFMGGHHIDNRKDRYKGNIVNIDFISAYPHAIMMGNLLSLKETGWNGSGYFNIKGTYDDKKLGKKEEALRQIFLERLKAKHDGEMAKSNAYKIVINSLYGTLGNSCFKTFYNPISAGDCTSIVRTWMKKLAKILSVNGYEILYGFTDSIMVLIPEYSSESKMMYIVDKFVTEVKSKMPFPQETFGLEIDKRLKFIWFVAKNCYLWVDDKNKIGYKRTLFNKNTPKVILNVLEKYISPRIIKTLDVKFTEEEITKWIYSELQTSITLCAEEHNVQDISHYKVKTSLQYQISKMYGEGKHYLIPNSRSIGVGRAKSTKKRKGVRYCTINEFLDKKLSHKHIDITQLLQHIKPFIGSSNKTIILSTE